MKNYFVKIRFCHFKYPIISLGFSRIITWTHECRNEVRANKANIGICSIWKDAISIKGAYSYGNQNEFPGIHATIVFTPSSVWLHLFSVLCLKYALIIPLCLSSHPLLSFLIYASIPSPLFSYIYFSCLARVLD
jgi:hypothetical protein